MKKYLLLFVGVIAAKAGFSQNSFPATGDVSIGTTTTNADLEVNGTSFFHNTIKIGPNPLSGEGNGRMKASASSVSFGWEKSSSSHYGTQVMVSSNGQVFLTPTNSSFGVQIRNNVNGNKYMNHSVDLNGNYFVGPTGSGNNNVPSLYIKDGGYVGIGTSNPTQKLEVAGSLKADAMQLQQKFVWKLRGTTQGVLAPVTAGYNDYSFMMSDAGSTVIGTQNAQAITLKTDGQNRVRVLGDGKVGIGTITPGEMLEVAGGVKLGSSNNGSEGTIIYENGKFKGFNGTEWVDLGSLKGDRDDNVVSARLTNTDGLVVENLNDESTTMLGSFKGNQNPVISLQSLTDVGTLQMAITKGWDFADASYALRGDVVFRQLGAGKNIIHKSKEAHIFSNGNGMLAKINDNGLGLGTSEPSAKLHIVGSENTGFVDNAGNAIPVENQTSTVRISSVDGSEMLIDGNEINTDAALRLNRDSDQDIILAEGGGSVGIGTDNPTGTLDISGANAELNITPSAVQNGQYSTRLGGININAQNSTFSIRSKFNNVVGHYFSLGNLNETNQIQFQGGRIFFGNNVPGAATSNSAKFQFGGQVYSQSLYVGNTASHGASIPTGYALAVNGKIICTEVRVKHEGEWYDKVFEDSYHLKSLSEVEAYINEYNHLEGIPSEAEVKENGFDAGEMSALLLQKVEELTLYNIQLNKQLEEQNQRIEQLQKSLEK